ncbi:MAG: hypothetical protein LBI10_06220 [Deltaproteobacteria bacterium]|jgi:hypothetical protein|nr:hypothetical protein [Deltaproteobacteria bacterium]
MSEIFQVLNSQLQPEPGWLKLAKSTVGYELEEARKRLLSCFEVIAAWIDRLPPLACPEGYVVLEVVLHPQRLRRVDCPRQFLNYLNFTILGSRKIKICPSKTFSVKSDLTDLDSPELGAPDPDLSHTISLYVAGRLEELSAIDQKIMAIQPDSPPAREITGLESVNPLDPADCLKSLGPNQAAYYEVTLHQLPNAGENFPLSQFLAYAKATGFKASSELELKIDGLFFVPVSGSLSGLRYLAQFVFVREIKEVGHLRSLCGDQLKGVES